MSAIIAYHFTTLNYLVQDEIVKKSIEYHQVDDIFEESTHVAGFDFAYKEIALKGILNYCNHYDVLDFFHCRSEIKLIVIMVFELIDLSQVRYLRIHFNNIQILLVQNLNKTDSALSFNIDTYRKETENKYYQKENLTLVIAWCSIILFFYLVSNI